MTDHRKAKLMPAQKGFIYTCIWSMGYERKTDSPEFLVPLNTRKASLSSIYGRTLKYSRELVADI